MKMAPHTPLFSALKGPSDWLIRRRVLCNYGSAGKKEFSIQHITVLFGGNEETIASLVIRFVLPLQDYISGTTHLQNSSNSQLKVTKSWVGSIVELLAFGTFSEQDFLALIQIDEPRGTLFRIGGNHSKEVFDLINGSAMMMTYQ
jgi:hypothetical protein